MKPIMLFASTAVVALTALPASAHEAIYSVSLSGAAEAPPNASPATGSGTITFDLDLLTMRVQASFSGLLANTTAAHIHCCTTIAGTATAGVATETPSFSGFPLGVTAGTYDHTFDLTQASSYRAAFITASGPGGVNGTVSDAMNALLLGAAAGKAYLNIHTVEFSGGEIRGFLQPVPEPEAYALLIAGLAITGWAARRRRAV